MPPASWWAGSSTPTPPAAPASWRAPCSAASPAAPPRALRSPDRLNAVGVGATRSRVNAMRPIVAMVLITIALLLTALAYASPPDPTWVGGFWDDGDFDDVVIVVTSVLAIPTRHRIDAPPTRIVLGLLLEAPTPTIGYDGSGHHAPP